MIQVQIASTPNPAVMKFQFSQSLVDGQFHFDSIEDAFRSPLASKIFGFPWVLAVSLGSDFVTVTKASWVEWGFLQEPLAKLIEEHIQLGEELLNEQIPASNSHSYSPLEQKIHAVLDKEIRPAVALDGGDVQFSRFENGIVYLKMLGACSGCPSQSTTLKQGIEVRLKELSPEILEVRNG